MKVLFCVRHGESSWTDLTLFDEERELTENGLQDIRLLGYEMDSKGIKPDLVLSSCAIRAQDSTLELTKVLEYEGKIHYMQELYQGNTKRMQETIYLQADEHEQILLMGHNKQLTDLINTLTDEHIEKMFAASVIAISFDTDSWSKLETVKGKVEFFIQANKLELLAS